MTLPRDRDIEEFYKITMGFELSALVTAWDYLCTGIGILYVLEAFVNSNTRYLCAITDILYFIDIIVRLISSNYFIKNQFNSNITDSHSFLISHTESQPLYSCYDWIWLAIDLILVLPYGFIFIYWDSLPAFKLLEIKNTHQKPILTFLRQKLFRQQLFKTIKEHFIFRKSLIEYYHIITMATKRFQIRPFISRQLGRLSFLPKINRKVSIAKYYLSLSQQFSLIIMTLRVILFTVKRSVLPHTMPMNDIVILTNANTSDELLD